eukprot:NODE_1019_length_1319_cov_53.512598_g840_i0.p1 GENE.NODE_1019_length_1319_cov_53.512598_g840_i0~~NODE_1019_length_1319_cov_53.512598_g840_i0.p1  ORF type:complete len:176 (-),score=39.51 NODE_1019_length_1319_cov_53.512598_g840_i0:722-1249(-)
MMSWPDGGEPSELDDLVQVIGHVDAHIAEQTGRHPILVHCSAGCGRTGVFLAVHIGLLQWRKHQTNCEAELPFHFNMYELICNLRQQRAGLVQTASQLGFCYRLIIYYTSQIDLEVKSFQEPVEGTDPRWAATTISPSSPGKKSPTVSGGDERAGSITFESVVDTSGSEIDIAEC